MKSINIRSIREGDAASILDIYSPYITDTCVTFETQIPSLSDFAARIEKISSRYPFLVCEVNGVIAGYAYASPYGERQAYCYSADLSIYISPAYHRQGIGRMLYENIIVELKERGIYTVYACVTHPNEKSERFHESLGFRKVGHFHNIGYKMGRWLDVIWYELPLREYGEPEK